MLDEELTTWRSRTLDKVYPYLVADAHYEYVREDGRVESEGVLLIKGIDEYGYREILPSRTGVPPALAARTVSVAVAPAEEEASWGEVFSDLLARGLDAGSVRCLVSDEHLGLRAAMRRYLPRMTWQRCQTHSPKGHASRSAKRCSQSAQESPQGSPCRAEGCIQRPGC